MNQRGQGSDNEESTLIRLPLRNGDQIAQNSNSNEMKEIRGMFHMLMSEVKELKDQVKGLQDERDELREFVKMHYPKRN